MFQHENSVVQIAIALQSEHGTMVRLSSSVLSNWLDDAAIYNWKGFRIFVYESYGLHDLDSELRDLIRTVNSFASIDDYAILVDHKCQKESGNVELFRLNEIIAA
jgi:hypothetical protein